jgi:glycogen debranching enzyme
VPSNDLTAPTFDPRLYWRGPTWVNTNWLLWRGLHRHGYAEEAGLVRAGVFEAVRTSGLHEYFDPFDGTGRGSAAFGWTAALAIDMEVSADGPGGTD